MQLSTAIFKSAVTFVSSRSSSSSYKPSHVASYPLVDPSSQRSITIVQQSSGSPRHFLSNLSRSLLEICRRVPNLLHLALTRLIRRNFCPPLSPCHFNKQRLCIVGVIPAYNIMKTQLKFARSKGFNCYNGD